MVTTVDVRPDEAAGTPGGSSSDDRRRSLMIRAAVVVASVLVVAVVAPEVIGATFSGPGPFLRVTALVVGLLVWSALVGRVVANPWARRALVLVPTIALTWWSLSPYVGDDRVDEAFPVAAGAPAASTDDVDASPDDFDASPGDTSAGVSPDAGSSVDASETSAPVPVDPTEATPAVETPAPSGAAPTPSEPPAASTPLPAEPAGPVALQSGSFQGLTGHRGSGTATVYDLGDGSRVLRLEDFDVSNGPGLELWVVPGADQRGPGEGIKLSNLKGNQGNQNYDVPADLDLSGSWTVLIWCEPFTVEVANATLSPA